MFSSNRIVRFCNAERFSVEYAKFLALKYAAAKKNIATAEIDETEKHHSPEKIASEHKNTLK